MRFKVERGIHRVGKKSFKKGQVIETDVNLCALFPGRFTNLSEKTKVIQQGTVPVSDPPIAESPVEKNEEEMKQAEDQPESNESQEEDIPTIKKKTRLKEGVQKKKKRVRRDD